MGLDVLKKLRGEAQARRTKGERPQEQKYEPAHKYFVSNNWNNLIEKRPKISPKAAGVAPEGLSISYIVALDCEMVGVGPGGVESALARVSIVDYDGNVLMDRYVRPMEPVTDYRTHITGITARTLLDPKVVPEETAQQRVAEMLKGKVVVGHSLANDFQALNLHHPLAHLRDTAIYRPLRPPGAEKKLPSLQRLSAHWLGEKIHDSSHDSVEDARMALRLYKMRSKHWEKTMRTAMTQSAGREDEGVSSDDEGELFLGAPPTGSVGKKSEDKKVETSRGAEVKAGSKAHTYTENKKVETSREAKVKADPKVEKKVGNSREAEAKADSNAKEQNTAPKAVPANPGKKLRKRLKALAEEEAAAAKLAEKQKRPIAAVAQDTASQPALRNPSKKQRKRLKEAAAAAAEGTATAIKPAPRNPSKKQRKRLKADAGAAAAEAQQP